MGHLDEYILDLLDPSPDLFANSECPDIELWRLSPGARGRVVECIVHGLESADHARHYALTCGLTGQFVICNQFGNVDEFGVA